MKEQFIFFSMEPETKKTQQHKGEYNENNKSKKRRQAISTITTKDGKIYYKNWGMGQPAVFSHGWPTKRREEREMETQRSPVILDIFSRFG